MTFDTDFEYLEHYHIHGGTYELPTEVLTSLCSDIEDLESLRSNYETELTKIYEDLTRRVNVISAYIHSDTHICNACVDNYNFLIDLKVKLDELLGEEEFFDGEDDTSL